MTVSDYIADYLYKLGVTDVFGIPGGVILDLIYAFDRKDGIKAHLSYHEQCGGFAACGYAQSTGKLGVAYSTRGPGFTNMITPIAEAYFDSLPTLFITSHSEKCPEKGMRTMFDQEIDTCDIVKNITKYCVRIDSSESFALLFTQLCSIALEERKGPVFIDISSKLFKEDIDVNEVCLSNGNIFIPSQIANELAWKISQAKRPVILVGDGVNQANLSLEFRKFIQKAMIPVISSRFSHDVICGSNYYYGYVGSHGIRTANFILSKTDLIIAIGNRLNFPIDSQSYSSVFTHAKLIRYEIDKGELKREIPNSENHLCDIIPLLKSLAVINLDYGSHEDWVEVCNILRDELMNEDTNYAICAISKILSIITKDTIVVNDVGNNEFWVSRACVLFGIQNRVLYSKSFGALGSALGKAIGAYYANHHPILCFIGDQGFQMNIQELQFISQNQLPIIIVLLNNRVSGMIRDREKLNYDKFIHTTFESGFRNPEYKKIMEGYGIPYVDYNSLSDNQIEIMISSLLHPIFLDIQIDENIVLGPSLPKGNVCQDFHPSLSTEKYNYLNNL